MKIHQNIYRKPDSGNSNSGTSGSEEPKKPGKNKEQGDGTGTVIKPGGGKGNVRDTTS